MASIEDLAKSWLRIDRDPATRSEMEQLLSEHNIAELELRLRSRIAFGTAGLRARMEAGFTRMNCVTVIQASQGLAAYILAQEPAARSKGVVVGHDARYNSEKFARLAAAAFVAKGIKVWWFRTNVHTPLVPFAVSERKAAAGVMVTASHNPARDNGYKVYWSNGCQIIPPHDKGIADAIDQNLEPVSWDEILSSDSPAMVEEIVDASQEAYYERISNLVNLSANTILPPFVYTPMHGVGLPFLTNTIRRITRKNPTTTTTNPENPAPFITVPSQALPDPAFPTVNFPNPEEAGALSLATSTADTHSIPLIIATDPDADRLAVAEKLSTTSQWYQFTGNEIGVLLASHVLETSHPSRATLCMLCSTVSSAMLSAMAEAEGFHFAETLTGFKWLGNVAQQLAREKGWHIPFAYEEALGYMFTGVGHDKDGVAAAAMFLAAAARWRDELRVTPWGRLQQLYARYGYFADANTYLISSGPDVTKSVFEEIRALQHPHPTHLAHFSITRWRDLTVGFDSATPDNVPELPVDGGSQMITCELAGAVRFTVRGSGTEPKIKLYVEARAEGMEEAKRRAEEVRDVLIREWFSPERWGLRLPG